MISRQRHVDIAPARTTVTHGAGGVAYLRSPVPLSSYPDRVSDCLERWAEAVPNRVWLAQRAPDGQWRRLTYGEAVDRVRSIAGGLLGRGLSTERPIAILSGNGIDHAIVAMAAMYAGIPYAPIAPAYSLQSRDFGTLRYLFDALRPGLVFVADTKPYEAALQSSCPPNIKVISGSLTELEAGTPSDDLRRAHARVTPETIAKILFTSGSTGTPKGVVNTHRMLCSNQEMLRSVFRCVSQTAPVLCDWLPWNHTFGGNHNFGLVLYNGGTLYIDEGNPTPEGIAATVRNLTEIAPTAYFNVPRGYEMLLPELRRNEALRKSFFSRVQFLFYAAAGLSQGFWNQLQELAEDTCGERILMVTGLGTTETAPFALCTCGEEASSGMVGVPAPGVELKIVPLGDRYEARLRGPNVTPGYWPPNAPAAESFDEEGFFKLGDALRPIDPLDLSRGFFFDGRFTEDFKLSSGTWVVVGRLRARLLAEIGGVVRDVVVAGHDRPFVTALIFPNLAASARLCGLPADVPAEILLARPELREAVRSALSRIAETSTGTSTFVARALLMKDAPSMDRGELTDKGSINQQQVLRNRAGLVEQLYESEPMPDILVA